VHEWLNVRRKETVVHDANRDCGFLRRGCDVFRPVKFPPPIAEPDDLGRPNSLIELKHEGRLWLLWILTSSRHGTWTSSWHLKQTALRKKIPMDCACPMRYEFQISWLAKRSKANRSNQNKLWMFGKGFFRIFLIENEYEPSVSKVGRSCKHQYEITAYDGNFIAVAWGDGNSMWWQKTESYRKNSLVLQISMKEFLKPESYLCCSRS